jgi:hypothetical protein
VGLDKTRQGTNTALGTARSDASTPQADFNRDNDAWEKSKRDANDLVVEIGTLNQAINNLGSSSQNSSHGSGTIGTKESELAAAKSNEASKLSHNTSGDGYISGSGSVHLVAHDMATAAKRFAGLTTAAHQKSANEQIKNEGLDAITIATTINIAPGELGIKKMPPNVELDDSKVSVPLLTELIETKLSLAQNM